ncbi:MAG: ATP-grasp domain-containing protein [archaeon]
MKVAILSNLFPDDNEYKEVEDDLMEFGRNVQKALVKCGHEVVFFDVNETTFEKLRTADIDIAFNVCERFNGNSLFEPHVAAMLELLNIPYTGSGPLTLATCINKVRVKEILMHHGIPTPRYQVFYSKNRKLNPELNFPLIVKPAQMDNSIGIRNDSVVYTEDDLRRKVAYILRTYDQPALVEEFIDGREITVGILGTDKTTVLPIVETCFDDFPEGMNKILGYDAKWYIKCPYTFPESLPKYLEARIKKIALDVYDILGVRDYGRVDFRVGPDNVPYVLEMNPNPGISFECFLPIAARKHGIQYHELINMVLVLALERQENKIKVLPTPKQERVEVQ